MISLQRRVKKIRKKSLLSSVVLQQLVTGRIRRRDREVRTNHVGRKPNVCDSFTVKSQREQSKLKSVQLLLKSQELRKITEAGSISRSLGQ